MISKLKKNRIKLNVIVLTIVLLLIGVTIPGCIDSEDELLLATTTSTYDSGLLDEIVPHFEEEYDVNVKITAVGTGQALELGKRGDADVLLVHAPELEEKFVEDGYGEYRYEVMYNEFVIVGPKDDQAGINGLNNIDEALDRIYENRTSVTFCSRGDDSGTHVKEIELWESAGFDYDYIESQEQADWYKSLGQGMGDTLRDADEMEAYALTDEGTHISMQHEIDGLDVHVRGDEALFNQYGVIPVNSTMHPEINHEHAEEFAQWIISEEIQEMIGNYAMEGEELFTPNA